MAQLDWLEWLAAYDHPDSGLARRLSWVQVPHICAWFEERGFDRVSLTSADYFECVGAHRRTAPPEPPDPDAVMFAFANHTQTGPARR